VEVKTEPNYPRVAASLGEPMLLRGPEEGCPSGRTVGQLVRWDHPGEIPTYFLGGNIRWTRRWVPFWEASRSDGTMTPSWRDPHLFPREALALTVGQSAAEVVLSCYQKPLLTKQLWFTYITNRTWQ